MAWYEIINAKSDSYIADRDAEDMLHRMVKGKIVDWIAAVEQSSVDIKEVGAGCVPAEARANKGIGRDCRLLF